MKLKFSRPKRWLSLVLAFCLLVGTLPVMPAMANPTDLPSDWPMPSEGTYEFKSQLKKLHVTYSGITENTIELTLNYQSTVHPPHIHFVDMRLDPRLVEHIKSIEGKSTQYLGFETTVNFEPMDTPIYNDVPYYQNVYRVRLGGADGIFTGIPWGAEVYEAKIILHLNKKTSELPQDLYYTVETRGIGTVDDKIGSPVKYFDTSTMNSTTFIKLTDEVPAPDKTKWLKNNSTATVEYESGGTLTTEKSVANNREEVEFGQGVMRIKYYIYPKMLLHHSYNGLIDQYKHYSMAVDLEDKLLDLIPEDAKIRVNAVRRIGTAYNHLEVSASDYIVREPGKPGGELRLSVYGPESRNNPDKTGPTDPLINNHNMYIPADADGAMPTYVQIEIPIDESKAAENFNYNQYNVQMFYYNKIGRLVTNSLVRAFTNGAKTSNPPSILEGKAQLFGTKVKGTGAQVGSTIYVVSATDAPDNFTDGGLLKPGKGRLISKGKINKDDLTFSIENPETKMFSEIVNEATGELYKEGEKIYVFQAVPGRMMSYGQPVILEAIQTQTPYIDPVTGKLKIDAQYFNSITGNVPKNDPTADLEVTMRVYRGGSVEGGEVQNHLIVGGELKNGVPLKYKTSPLSEYKELVYGPVKASAFDGVIAQNGYVEQDGDSNLLVVNRDGSFSVYHKNNALVQLKNNGNIQKGDIIEIVATEEHNKESVKVYHIVGENAPEGSSTAVPPNVAPVHPTVAGDGNDGTPGNDKNEVYDNKPLEKIRVQTLGNNRTQYKVDIFREGQTDPMWTSGAKEVGKGWHDVTLPASVQLLPGDKVYVYQKLGSGITGWTEWSEPKVANVTPDPNEYYYYEFEIFLEGKGDKPVETIKVHRNKQAYPEETINYPLPAVKASDPQISTPQTLIDFLITKGVAQSYLYNRDESTQFSVRPTKDFEAYWANIAQGKQNANIAAHANNKYQLVFGKDPRFWGELLFNAGAQGYYHPEDFAKDNEELITAYDSIKYTGIKFNETTWANVKESTGLTNENIVPKANPGYKFTNFVDEQGNFVDLKDDKTFEKPTELTAQFDIDENQFFGYEVQYVYNTGTEEEPVYEAVPGKETVKGKAPLESIVAIAQEPVDGFAVKSDQPKEFKVEYLRQDQNGDIVDNQVLNDAEPAIRQIVKVVYEVAESEKPVITTDPVMDTTEVVKGTAAPYAGIKLYYAKNIAAAGEEENWVADKDRLIGVDTTDKDGKWSVKAADLIVGEKIIAVAKDPLKAEAESDPKDIVNDIKKYTGQININPLPKDGEEIVEGQIFLAPNPTYGDPIANGYLAGTIVDILDENDNVIGHGVAGKEGKFIAPVRPEKLTAGKLLKAKAKPKKSHELTGEAVVAAIEAADAPVINDIAHLDTVIKGTATTATAGDEVVVTIDDTVSVKTTVKADGAWEVKAPAALQSGQVVKAVVVPADKTIDKSAPAEKFVGLNTTGLQESYDKATPIVGDDGANLDPNSNTDKDLKDAYDKAKEVLDNANGPNPTVTQDEIDAAKKALDDALAEKEKFEEAKTAVDEAKANPSKETIAAAQEKIDALKNGDDKTKLQKELDKIKLEEAIKKADEKLEDPNLDPTDKKAIEDAKKVVEDDLGALNDPAKEDPTHDKINTDIKNLEDAINGAKNQTKLDPLAPVKTGAQQVKGTSEEGAVVKIFVDDVEVGSTTAGADGAFTYNHDKPLNAGQVVKAIAKVEDKTDSRPQEVTVGIDISGLQDAIEKGETALTERNDGKGADTELQAAIDAGKALITPEGTPVEGKTQEDVDKAEKDIRGALDKKEKTDAAEDKVKALEDKQAGDQTLPENKITPEEIVEAQQAIDAIPGSIEEDTPDFNQDKKDLQDRLDKVKALEDLKDVVEKGKEEVEKAKEEGKPSSVIENTEKVIEEAEKVIENNGDGKTVEEIKTETEKVEEAIKDLSRPFVLISTVGLVKPGMDSIVIRTNPGNADVHVVLKRGGVEVEAFDIKTPGTGLQSLSLGEKLQAGDVLEITANATDYLETTSANQIN